MSNNLPERINVMKVVSYDVQKILADIKEMGGQGMTGNPNREPDLSDVMEFIETWVQDDFSCGFGHDSDLRDLIYQDENGEELDW